ncbi:MAG: BON domain-containing protein [Dehalococcoidia bacterium]
MSAVAAINLELRERIEEAITEELAEVAAGIGVAVDGEVAMLAGHVSSFHEKWAAEEGARRAGPSAIVNELEVRLLPEDERTDIDIARAAVNTLKWDVGLPSDRIQVSVDHGVVVLDGTVDWAYQVASASQALAHLVGLRALSNRLAVQPRVSADEVERQITAALERAAVIDASHVKVTVSGSTHVMLSGHVRSWPELEEAERAAAAVPGVTAVANHLKIANW